MLNNLTFNFSHNIIQYQIQAKENTSIELFYTYLLISIIMRIVTFVYIVCIL